MAGSVGHARTWRRGTAPLLVVLASCTSTTPPPTDSMPARAPAERTVVVAVIDGDTVDVRIAGRAERVRLIGVDTPETVHPNKPVECYGPEASARLSELLPPGTEIDLAGDVEERDRYGRLLAYVLRRTDDLFVNLALVAEGYAGILPLPPNTAFAADLEAAEAAARAARLGRWGSCAAGAGR